MLYFVDLALGCLGAGLLAYWAVMLIGRFFETLVPSVSESDFRMLSDHIELDLKARAQFVRIAHRIHENIPGGIRPCPFDIATALIVTRAQGYAFQPVISNGEEA